MTKNNGYQGKQSGKIKKVVPKEWQDSPEKLVNMILNGFKQLEEDLRKKPKS